MAIKRRVKDTSFKGIDLNETTVQDLFNVCLAKEGTPKEHISKSILFSRLNGYSTDDEKIVYFDKEKALINKQNIKYLFGQLKNVHSQNEHLQIDDAFVSYLNKPWTSNNGILLEFLYLGAMDINDLISIFDKKTSSTLLSTNILSPTLSPKDPNFPAWWEEHKSEWETPAKSGQEPADD